MIKVINVPAGASKEDIEELKAQMDDKTVLHFDLTDKEIYVPGIAIGNKIS